MGRVRTSALVAAAVAALMLACSSATKVKVKGGFIEEEVEVEDTGLKSPVGEWVYQQQQATAMYQKQSGFSESANTDIATLISINQRRRELQGCFTIALHQEEDKKYYQVAKIDHSVQTVEITLKRVHLDETETRNDILDTSQGKYLSEWMSEVFDGRQKPKVIEDKDGKKYLQMPRGTSVSNIVTASFRSQYLRSRLGKTKAKSIVVRMLGVGHYGQRTVSIGDVVENVPEYFPFDPLFDQSKIDNDVAFIFNLSGLGFVYPTANFNVGVSAIILDSFDASKPVNALKVEEKRHEKMHSKYMTGAVVLHRDRVPEQLVKALKLEFNSKKNPDGPVLLHVTAVNVLFDKLRLSDPVKLKRLLAIHGMGPALCHMIQTFKVMSIESWPNNPMAPSLNFAIAFDGSQVKKILEDKLMDLNQILEFEQPTEGNGVSRLFWKKLDDSEQAQLASSWDLEIQMEGLVTHGMEYNFKSCDHKAVVAAAKAYSLPRTSF